MIISHKHKFVFTRPPKVGSSSAQAMIVESGILGDGDVFTGYRDDVGSPLSEFRNVPDISCDDIRRVSPYEIPIRLFAKNQRGMPLLGHLTPTEMYLFGLIDDDILNTYMFASIVREPIDRYLSAWFFIKKLTNRRSKLDGLIYDISMGKVPNTLLGRGQRDYFTCNNKPIKNQIVFNTNTLTSDIKKFIEPMGGKVRDVALKKGRSKSDWASEDYKDWLPKEQIKMLENIISDDFNFYKETMG